MNQLTLEQEFKRTPLGRPLARDSDPITSHEAAEKILRKGWLNAQERKVYEAILSYSKTHSNFTTKDIAASMAKSMANEREAYWKCYDICRKRFSGLRMKGKIERLNTEGGLYQENKGQKLMKRDGCAVWIRRTK